MGGLPATTAQDGTTDLPGRWVAFLYQRTSGATKVSVLLSSRLVSATVESKATNSRLLWVSFKLRATRVFLLATYAPVSSAPLSEFDEFSKSVRDVVS